MNQEQWDREKKCVDTVWVFVATIVGTVIGIFIFRVIRDWLFLLPP
jgi:predicted membrane protein